MSILSLFALPQEVQDRARRDITDALVPAHSIIAQRIISQEHNVAVQLPRGQIAGVMHGDALCLHRDRVRDADVWGLRLAISPCRDDEGDKTWIKKVNIWYRMLKEAGDQAEIGYRAPDAAPESLFTLASDCGLARDVGPEVLLCAIGPTAQKALQEAVYAEKQFDSKQWDIDGYAVGPSKT